jgi:hypothetical protein
MPDLKERKLLRVLPEWEPEPVELYALHPSRLAAPPKVRALLEFLGKHCNNADCVRVLVFQGRPISDSINSLCGIGPWSC